MLTRGKYPYLASVLLVIAILSIPAAAQDKDITNEYRLTAVSAIPINKKWIAWQYSMLLASSDKGVTTIALSPPGIIYKPKDWLELWAGMLPTYNNYYHTSNSWELRPLGGFRVYLPNEKKVNIYNFARYEYKFIYQNHTTTHIPRFRDRTGIEMPLAKGDNRWKPGTFYAAGDVEPIWRLDDKFMEKLRVRGTLGYIVKKRLSVEFIYHAEFSGPKGEPKKFTGNIWRLNFKLLFARGKGLLPRIDVDD
jgi:hypothetical protein